MAASNTRFTQNSLGQSKNLIDSDHGIYRDPPTCKSYFREEHRSLAVMCSAFRCGRT
jgi:hypothetical protein